MVFLLQMPHAVSRHGAVSRKVLVVFAPVGQPRINLHAKLLDTSVIRKKLFFADLARAWIKAAWWAQ